MKPDTEYIARQLASYVLDGDRGGGHGYPHDAGVGVVNVELQGMTRNIRRAILADHVELAGRIADEIEKATSKVNIDKLVAEAVAAEIKALPERIRTTVGKQIQGWVDYHVSGAVNATDRVSAEVKRVLAKEWTL